MDARRRVFISYSRKDGAFAERLRVCLMDRGYDAYLDIEDILPGEPWRERLEGLIRSADAVAFIISPESIASEVCAWEVDRSLELKKVVAPVYWRPAPNDKIPKALAARNFVFFDAFERSGMADPAALAAALDRLDVALQLTDKLWVREHTKWVARAAEWDSTGREDGMLLPAGEVAAVEAWSRLKHDDALEYPDVLVDYYCASKRKIEADSQRLRRTAGRAFVKPAQQAIAEGRYEHALRLVGSGAVIADDIDFELVPDLWPAVAQAAIECRTRSVMHGHEGCVYHGAFSPDGSRIVTVGLGLKDNAIVWDAARRNKLFVLEGHENSVFSVQWSADGAFILTGSGDTTARLWNAETGAAVMTFRGHAGSVQHAELSPDGSRVLTYSNTYDGDPQTDRSVRLWDVATGRQISKFTEGNHQTVTCARMSPDGRLCAAVLHLGREIVVWEMESAQQIAKIGPHSDYVHDFCFSPDSRLLATACEDKTASIWEVASSRQLAVMTGHRDYVGHVSFSPDGTRLLTRSSDEAIRLWNVDTGTELCSLGTAPHGYCAPAWSPDGGRIVTMTDNVAFIWDARTGRSICAYREHDRYGRAFRKWIRGARFSADGHWVLTWGDDGTARVWDAAPSREAVACRHENQVWDIRFTPDGAQLLSVCKDETVHVWDALDGTEISRLSAPASSIWRSKFSPDGRRVAMIPRVNEGHPVAIYDSMSGERSALMTGHTSYVERILFDAGGTRLLSVGLDETVRLWDAATGEQLWSAEGQALNAAFSPGGRFIATCDGSFAYNSPSDHNVKILSADTGEHVQTLDLDGPVHEVAFSPEALTLVTLVKGKPPRLWLDVLGTPHSIALEGHEGDDVGYAAFSPDGRWLLTAPFRTDQDERILVWDASTGERLSDLVLRDGKHFVTNATFSPDSRRIVTAGDDTRIWDTERGVVIQRLGCRSAAAVFSPDGLRLATFQHDPQRCVRIWNVARSAVAMVDRAVLMTGALERGIGTYSESERVDLLLTDAPEHLGVEAGFHLAASSARTGDKRAQQYLSVSDALAEPFEPGCYLAPSDFADLFGVRCAVDTSPDLLTMSTDEPVVANEAERKSGVIAGSDEVANPVAVSSPASPAPPALAPPRPVATPSEASRSTPVWLTVIGLVLLVYIVSIALWSTMGP